MPKPSITLSLAYSTILCVLRGSIDHKEHKGFHKGIGAILSESSKSAIVLAMRKILSCALSLHLTGMFTQWATTRIASCFERHFHYNALTSTNRWNYSKSP
jgi:hypothetical protein